MATLIPDRTTPHPVFAKINPSFLALSRIRRRRFDEALTVCNEILEKTPLDTQVWFMKTRTLTMKQYVDDSDMEEEGVAEILMDENAIAKAPRPGTSLKRPTTQSSGINQSVRPMTGSGRPLTGFARPATQSRGSTSRAEDAFSGARPGTSRPMSVAGRFVRLATQSLLLSSQESGIFIDADRINVSKFAQPHKQAEAKALCDYLIYHDRNIRKALELAAECTKAADFKDWWWKARLGKCYYQLGDLREAEKQLRSAMKHQEMTILVLELSKVYLRLDQPNSALELFARSSERQHGELALYLGQARVYELLGEMTKSSGYYKKVLHYDPSHIEALASLASHAFYEDQPEVAIRFYRRLLQLGVKNTEIWCNLGLCCFYSGQYDMTLSCFEKALTSATDENAPDVWFNLSQVGIGIGDLNLAYQCLKIALSLDPNHAESANNLGILELRKGNVEQARAHFYAAGRIASHMFEPFFNTALVAFKLGDCQESFEMAAKSLEIFPQHTDSKELLKQLKKHFTML